MPTTRWPRRAPSTSPRCARSRSTSTRPTTCAPPSRSRQRRHPRPADRARPAGLRLGGGRRQGGARAAGGHGPRHVHRLDDHGHQEAARRAAPTRPRWPAEPHVGWRGHAVRRWLDPSGSSPGGGPGGGGPDRPHDITGADDVPADDDPAARPGPGDPDTGGGGGDPGPRGRPAAPVLDGPGRRHDLPRRRRGRPGARFDRARRFRQARRARVGAAAGMGGMLAGGGAAAMLGRAGMPGGVARGPLPDRRGPARTAAAPVAPAARQRRPAPGGVVGASPLVGRAAPARVVPPAAGRPCAPGRYGVPQLGEAAGGRGAVGRRRAAGGRRRCQARARRAQDVDHLTHRGRGDLVRGRRGRHPAGLGVTRSAWLSPT